jgi:hypothetical protein
MQAATQWNSSFFLGLSIGVLSIAATAFVGWYFFRRRPVGITFFKERCIGLFEAIVQNLPELEILYQQNRLLENTVVLLKGFFLNTGVKAIEPTMVEENLTIILPEGFQWLTGKIVSTRSKMAQVKTDGRRLVFELGLFQRREFVHFVALARLPLQLNVDAGKTLEEKMLFELRIADIETVKMQDIPTSDRLKFLKRQLIVPSILLFAVYAFAFWVIYWPPTYLQIQYSMPLTESNSVNVIAYITKDGNVEVKDTQGNLIEILPFKTFFHERKLEPQFVVQKTPLFNSLLASVSWVFFLIFPLIMISIPIWPLWKAKNLKKLLNLN